MYYYINWHVLSWHGFLFVCKANDEVLSEGNLHNSDGFHRHDWHQVKYVKSYNNKKISSFISRHFFSNFGIIFSWTIQDQHQSLSAIEYNSLDISFFFLLPKLNFERNNDWCNFYLKNEKKRRNPIKC